MSWDGEVIIETSLSGTTAEGPYCGNGPWYRRSGTAGPGPQSYFSQLCSGMAAFALDLKRPTASPVAVADFKKLRRFIVALRQGKFGATPEIVHQNRNDTKAKEIIRK